MSEPVLSAPSDDEVELLDRWWRAANYLSVGQIYLLDNPLLRVPLAPEHVKPRLLGHWGTTSGQNFLYAHLNRAVKLRDLQAIYVCGPGHGGPAVVANTYLEGVYSEVYPRIGRDAEGMRRLFRQFSFPGGIPSHAAPQTPGSINEGGELGYSLMHATGAVLDDPELVAFCVIGDGEAETGPLATSWHAPAFLDPVRDGTVVPILHLNGYKIANPSVLARLPEEQLLSLIRGWGWEPVVVAGDDPATMHRDLAAALGRVLDRVDEIRRGARAEPPVVDPGATADLDGAVPDGGPRPATWPMIVFRSPKGWTGPRTVDGEQVEGTFRAHQVPLAEVRTNPEHLAQLDEWLRSYRADELFDEDGALRPELQALAPEGDRRMGANPRTNGGLLLRDLELPDFRGHAVRVDSPARTMSSATTVLGGWLRDVMAANPDRFRLFGPDETASNRLQAVFETTDRAWQQPVVATDDHLAPGGRVMEVLSEHLLQGWLEGYLLTGRHGLLSSYEAFAHIVDSMVNQHAKWLHDVNRIPWRRDLASLNYLITSHVWRQDHNGSSHQDPGFIDHVVNKKAELARVYLPPDANTLLSTFDHVLRSRQTINVVVAGKQQQLDYLTMDEAIAHCTRGLGIWEWASSTDGEPDVVLAAAGEVPTMEALAAVDLLRQHLPELKVRFVNVVDLMRLESPSEHPHGLDDAEFDAIFTADKPVVFAFHGYPTLVHRLTYKRSNHAQFHVHGYIEEGTTTTPFDMVMMNRLDRFTLAMDAIDRVPGLASAQAALRQRFADARLAAREYTREHGEDDPAISGWVWPGR